MTSTLTCPDCKLDLAAVESGSVTARRCPRCRGVWLDPGSFRRLCADESRLPDDGTALAARRPSAERPSPPAEARVRYRACPACSEVMNRSNFGRVSGVVIDVCRAHGAWFDRGELGAIRRFLKGGGVHRYDRSRRMDGEVQARAPAPPRNGSLDDVYDVLVGGDGGWDVPSRIPRLLVAAVLAALGAGLLWDGFRSSRSYGRTWDWELGLGLVCLYFAWRALAQWAARRS